LANIPYSEKDPDIGIVIGKDSTFGYYGRILHIPMLFVGINDPNILGNRAKLAGHQWFLLWRPHISRVRFGHTFPIYALYTISLLRFNGYQFWLSLNSATEHE
jgi:hypothetical protein